MATTILPADTWSLARWVTGGLVCEGCGALSAETDRSDPEWRTLDRPGWLKVDAARSNACCIACVYRCTKCGPGA